LYDALSDSSSNEDEQSGLMMRGKTSSTLNNSGTHFVEAHAKNGNSQSNLLLPKERSNRPDHYHQPSNRVYNHDKPSAGKSQRLRREETEQLGHSSPNMEETIPSISVEESPSRKGNLKSSRSKTPASCIFYDSDGTTSESGEEIELERYNDRTSSKISKLPLFSDSSHGASSFSKQETKEPSSPGTSNPLFVELSLDVSDPPTESGDGVL